MARNSQAAMAHANGRTGAGHTRTTKGTKAKRGAAPKKKKEWEHGLGKKWKMNSCANPAPKIERMVQIRKSRIVKGLKHSAEMERISRSKTSFK